MPAKQRPKGGVRLTSKSVPSITTYRSRYSALHDADEEVRVPSIIALAGEAGQHVMYHYRCSAGKERWRGVVTGLRLPGVSRTQEKTVCGTRARSVAFRRVEGRVCDPRSRACAAARPGSGGHTGARVRIEEMEGFWKAAFGTEFI